MNIIKENFQYVEKDGKNTAKIIPILYEGAVVMIF